MKRLVTVPTSFICSTIMDDLHRSGHDVVGLARSERSAGASVGSRIDSIRS